MKTAFRWRFSRKWWMPSHKGISPRPRSCADEFSQRRQPPTAVYRPGDAELWRCLGQFFQGKLTDAEWQTGYDIAVRHRNVFMQYQFLALRGMGFRPRSAIQGIGGDRAGSRSRRSWAHRVPIITTCVPGPWREPDAPPMPRRNFRRVAKACSRRKPIWRWAITNGRKSVRSRLIAGPGVKGRRIFVGTTWSAAVPS